MKTEKNYTTESVYKAITKEFGQKMNRYPVDKAAVIRNNDGTTKNVGWQFWGRYTLETFLNRLEVFRLLTGLRGVPQADQVRPFRITAEQLQTLCEYMSNVKNYALVYAYCEKTFNGDMSAKNFALSMVRICVDAHVDFNAGYTTTPYLSRVSE